MQDVIFGRRQLQVNGFRLCRLLNAFQNIPYFRERRKCLPLQFEAAGLDLA